jgi:hypothetical protein
MRGFEPVTLVWQGESYIVPAENQLLLVAAIEDALAGASGQHAIHILTRAGGPSYVKLSQAYGAALRHAGADVTDDEIYLSIMSDFAEQNADVAVKVQAAIMALLAIVAPPIALSLSEPEPKKKRKKASQKAS